MKIKATGCYNITSGTRVAHHHCTQTADSQASQIHKQNAGTVNTKADNHKRRSRDHTTINHDDDDADADDDDDAETDADDDNDAG